MNILNSDRRGVNLRLFLASFKSPYRYAEQRKSV